MYLFCRFSSTLRVTHSEGNFSTFPRRDRYFLYSSRAPTFLARILTQRYVAVASSRCSLFPPVRFSFATRPSCKLFTFLANNTFLYAICCCAHVLSSPLFCSFIFLLFISASFFTNQALPCEGETSVPLIYRYHNAYILLIFKTRRKKNPEI